MNYQMISNENNFSDITKKDIMIAEIAVLNVLIYDRDVLDKDGLSYRIDENLFQTEVAKNVFKAISQLEKENKIQEPGIIINQIKSQFFVDDQKLRQTLIFFSNLNRSFDRFDIEKHIDILQVSQSKKKIDDLCQNVLKTNISLQTADDLFQKWQYDFLNFTTQKIYKNFLTSKQVINDYKILIEQVQNHGGLIDRFLKTNYSYLDQKIKGLIGGQLLILAARPGIGKTTFALNILVNNLEFIKSYNTIDETLRQPAIGVFSLEMTKESLLEKIIAIDAGLEINDVKKPLEGRIIEDPIKEQIEQSMDNLSQTNLLFCDRSDVTIMQICGMIKNWSHNYDLKLVIIDYLQLINFTHSRETYNFNQQQKIGLISRMLKITANDINIPIIALAQLNRKTEERKGDDREPLLSDLRESGSIEQDADIVMFLYQDKNQSNNDETNFENDNSKNYIDPKVTLKIGKNRHGEIGKINFVFYKKTGVFKLQTFNF